MTPEQLADEFQRLWEVRRTDGDVPLPRAFLVETFQKIGAPDLRGVCEALITSLTPHLPNEWMVVDDLSTPEDLEWQALGVSKVEWLLHTMTKVFFNPQIVDAPLALNAATRKRDESRQSMTERHERDRPVKEQRDKDLRALMASMLAAGHKDRAIVVRAGRRCYELQNDSRFNPTDVRLALSPSTLTNRLRAVRREMLEKPRRRSPT